MKPYAIKRMPIIAAFAVILIIAGLFYARSIGMTSPTAASATPEPVSAPGSAVDEYEKLFTEAAPRSGDIVEDLTQTIIGIPKGRVSAR